MGELRSLSNDSSKHRPHSEEQVRRQEEDTLKRLDDIRILTKSKDCGRVDLPARA
jgi:hypothetical protein